MNLGNNRTFATRRRFAPSALRNLVVFSILMMIVPITTYFAARNFYIGMNEPNEMMRVEKSLAQAAFCKIA
jgi:hypothetical protein